MALVEFPHVTCCCYITAQNRSFSLILDCRGTNLLAHGPPRGQIPRLDILVCRSYLIFHHIQLFQSEFSADCACISNILCAIKCCVPEGFDLCHHRKCLPFWANVGRNLDYWRSNVIWTTFQEFLSLVNNKPRFFHQLSMLIYNFPNSGKWINGLIYIPFSCVFRL